MDVEGIREQAQDENTAPETLAQLATSKDYLTRQYVTANPNAPTKTLLNLGAEFPKELLDNPIFDLLIIEDIDFLNKMPSETLNSILKQQDAPEYILEQACDRATLEVQLSLANNTNTSKKILSKLTTSKYSEVVEAAKLHIALAGEVKDNYDRQSQYLILNKLTHDKHHKITVKLLPVLIQIIPIPSHIIEYTISWSWYDPPCEILAKSPATPTEILDLIAKHKTKYKNAIIKNALAQNFCASVNTLRLLVSNLGWIGRKSLASNPKTPSDVLEQLAIDQDREVRRKVAENLNTNITVLTKLTKDKDKITARNAVRNIAIQTDKYDDLLKKYSFDMWIYDFLGNKKVYEISSETLKKIRYPNAVAEYPNTPENLLLKLSHHRISSVRASVAKNVKAPVYILKRLANDDSSAVRRAVAQNPNTPLKILFRELSENVSANTAVAQQLSSINGESPELDSMRNFLAEHSKSDINLILRRLIDDGNIRAKIFLAKRADLPLNFLMELAQTPDPKVQKAVADNPNTPIKSLEKLVVNEKVDVRQAVAKHSNTPSYILEMLAFDKTEKVRALAMRNTNLTKESVEQILCGEYAAEYPQYNPDFPKDNPDSLGIILDYYARSQSQFISYLALLRPQVNPKTLEEKSLSAAWLARFAVAQNTNTSLEVTKKLAEDCNQLVRAAAKDNLAKKEKSSGSN